MCGGAGFRLKARGQPCGATSGNLRAQGQRPREGDEVCGSHRVERSRWNGSVGAFGGLLFLEALLLVLRSCKYKRFASKCMFDTV